MQLMTNRWPKIFVAYRLVIDYSLIIGNCQWLIDWLPIDYSLISLMSSISYVWSLTPIICNVLVHCFCSFLYQDMFSNLQVVAFEEQNTMFIVNMLLTCIISISWRCAQLWLELFASTVSKFLSQVSYLPSHVFLRRHFL